MIAGRRRKSEAAAGAPSSVSRRVILPLSAQVFMLVFAAIVVGQLMAVASILMAPPSPPAFYTPGQIASALQGRRVIDGAGRVLKQRTVTRLPAEFEGGAGEGGAEARAIAAALGAPIENVRFVRRAPPVLMLLTPNGPMRPLGKGFGPPPGWAGDHPGERAWPRPVGEQPFNGPPPRLWRSGPGGVGMFVAAWRPPDGDWRIVEPNAQLWWIRRLAIWLGGGLLILGPLAYWFAQRISAPMRGFARAADELGKNPNAPMIAPRGPAEIGAAAQAFNAMQGRIQKYVKDRVSMVGAISHDLRTPLTRIRFKIERVPADLRGSILTDVEQMEAMIAAVLDFIREESATGAREVFDLTSLVAVVADESAMAGMPVEMALQEPLALVRGDAVALKRLLANLVDNAVKYGGSALLEVALAGEEAVVRVIDRGPGIAAADLERVFQPFVRGNDAERRADQGMGLGLAIARSIARAHGGDLHLEARADGLTAVVRLPISRA